MTTGKFLTIKFTSENDFTAKTNMWLSHNYPFLRGMYYHIRNESSDDQHHVPGKFGAGDMDRMKQFAMGVLPGVPDFRFEQVRRLIGDLSIGNVTDDTFEVRGDVAYYAGWYLELKMPGKKPDPKQRTLHERWQSNGIRVEWTDNAQGVVDLVVATYGKPVY